MTSQSAFQTVSAGFFCFLFFVTELLPVLKLSDFFSHIYIFLVIGNLISVPVSVSVSGLPLPTEPQWCRSQSAAADWSVPRSDRTGYSVSLPRSHCRRREPKRPIESVLYQSTYHSATYRPAASELTHWPMCGSSLIITHTLTHT